VKRSGRDEPVWVAIHKRMEAMLRISLYSYLYLKLAKTLFFSSTKLDNKRAEQVLPRKTGRVAQIMYTHVSKCKHNKMKFKKKDLTEGESRELTQLQREL
jgi:hypothetical protein